MDNQALYNHNSQSSEEVDYGTPDICSECEDYDWDEDRKITYRSGGNSIGMTY